MRCKHCGSKMIFPDVNHEHSSAGKVIAGTVAFGIVGAAATLAGKNVKGYRCSACGMFSETPMAAAEEVACNSAVIEAKVHGQSAAYERCKEKYPNIENVPLKVVADNSVPQSISIADATEKEEIEEIVPVADNVKRCYQPNTFVEACPVFVDQVTIKKSGTSDVLIMDVCNISKNTLRSAYFNVVVCDDVGDQIGTLSCVYQGLAVAPGGFLPREQEFNLKTDIAYSISVECEKVAFTDDIVWRKVETPVVHNLAQRQEITELNFPQYKYLRILLAEKTRITEDRKIYCPAYEENYRICICGNPVSVGKCCEVCGLDENGLLDITNFDTLMQCRRDLVVSTAKARAKKTERLYKEAQEEKYNEANALLEKGTEASCEQATSCFRLIIDYKDSKKKIKECQTRAEGAQKDAVYDSALAELSTRIVRQGQYEKAIAILEQIRGWRDANEKIEEYKKRIEEIKEKEEQKRIRREKEQEQRELWEKKRKKKNTIIGVVVAIVIAIAIRFLLFGFSKPI